MEKIQIEKVVYTDYISIEEYNELRESVDWVRVVPRRADIALNHSFFLLVARYEERPVGMVRIISDGGWSFLITDVIVRPEYQGKHIGKEMISRAIAFIEKDLLEGETVMVSLMSAYQKEGFYQKYGFHKRPFGNHGSGMSVWVTRKEDGTVERS